MADIPVNSTHRRIGVKLKDSEMYPDKGRYRIRMNSGREVWDLSVKEAEELIEDLRLAIRLMEPSKEVK